MQRKHFSEKGDFFSQIGRWLSYGEGLAVSLPEQRGAQVLLLSSDVTAQELQET